MPETTVRGAVARAGQRMAAVASIPAPQTSIGQTTVLHHPVPSVFVASPFMATREAAATKVAMNGDAHGLAGSSGGRAAAKARRWG